MLRLQLSLIYFLHQQRRIFLIFLLLLIIAVLNEVAIYHIGLITGSYYKVMNQKDKQGFITQTLKSLGLIIGEYACSI